MDQEELLELVSQLNPLSQSAMMIGIRRTVTQEDVAHCLAKIKPEGPSYYGRLKFAGQEAWAKDAAIRLSLALLDKMPGYKTPREFIGHGMILQICQAAIWEHMGNTRCPTCNGLGDFKHGNLLVTCITCEGFGTVTVRHDRHRVFNMDTYEWQRWNPIYLKALGILDRWQFRVLRVLVENFGGPSVRAYLYAAA